MTRANINRGLFITGTDTGVGKTLVGAAIAQKLRRLGIDVGVMKPVHTGCRSAGHRSRGGDTRILMDAAGVTDSERLVTPYCLRPALAPLAASRLQRVSLKISRLRTAYRALSRKHSILIVEGIGGLAVPLTARMTVLDLARLFDLPLLVVARAGLGTINHTRLTVEYARSRGVAVQGIILNHVESRRSGLAERTNPDLLEALCGIRIVGKIPYVPSLKEDRPGLSGRLDILGRHIDVKRILDLP